MKKFLSILLCVAILSSICIMAHAETSELVDVSLMTVLNTEDCILENNATWNELIKDSGLNFSYKYSTVATYLEEVPLSLNTGDYADVYWRCNFTDVQTQNYGSQEVFIDLKDLIKDNAPNLTKLLDENNLWNQIEDKEGHVWSLPLFNDSTHSTVNDFLFINKTYLDNLGIAEPKSMDEFGEYLRAVKTNDANGDGDATDEVPLSMPDFGQMQQALVPLMTNNYDRNNLTAIDENGDLYYVPMSENFKSLIRYLSTWYAEGLINQDYAEIKWADWNAFGRGSDDIGSFTRIHAWAFIGPEKTTDFITVKPFVPGTFGISSGIAVGGLCITDSCAAPELVVAMFDKLYSDEGSVFYSNGVENVTYEKVGDGIQYILGDYPDLLTMFYNETLWGNAIGCGRECIEWNQNTIDDYRVFNADQRRAVCADGAEIRPKLQFSVEESEEIALKHSELFSYIATYTNEVIRGAKDLDSSWDEYINNLQKMGALELEDAYKAAYNTAMGK